MGVKLILDMETKDFKKQCNFISDLEYVSKLHANHDLNIKNIWP